MDTGEQTPDNVIEINVEVRNRFNKKVADVFEAKMAAAEAEKLIREHEFTAGYRPATFFASAAEGLKIEWPPITFGVDRLAVTGSIVGITAGYKTGKTDLMFNLLRSYADETPFLGEFAIQPLDDGRQVMMLDFELDDTYSWNLLKMQGLQNPEKANLVNFRGRSFDLMNDEFRAELIESLKRLHVQVLIVDPFGAAYNGDENSNPDVRAWLEMLKVVKYECDIRELFITTHTGRAQAEEGLERARGATAFNDVVDVSWTYTKDQTPGTATPKHHRFLAAMGRHVELDEVTVQWASETHHLTILDGGGNRATQRRNSLQSAILQFISENPKSAKIAIKQGVTGKAATIGEALDEMSDGESALLDVEKGTKGALLFSLSAHGEWLMKHAEKINN